MTDTPQQRRLAAILAADVVGYSRMMGADEAGTLTAWKDHLGSAIEPALAAHRGRIVKTTGDGLLAEFASAVQAVECALAVQKAMGERNAGTATEKKFELRIGINVGDVIVDGDDIFGDGVNIAARLESSAKPGGLCVSRSVVDQVDGKVGAAFAALGPLALKNIAVAVEAFDVVAGERTARRAAAAPSPSTPDRPTIAILPLQILTEDRSLELLADGLLEDVISLVARISGFFVISRSSSFAYKNRQVDVREVGRELGVRYVVEGSIRADATRVRVGVQLVEAESGKQLWSQRFDVERNETLELQDDIARGLMAELEPALTRAEVSVIRRRHPDNLDAWSRYRRAFAGISLNGWNEETVGEGIQQLDRAIGLDQEFAVAHGLRALLIALGTNAFRLPDGDRLRAQAVASAERAIALDPDSSEVLGYAGCALCDLGDQRGFEYLQRAIDADPSNAQARVALGAAQTVTPEVEAGIENMRLGMRQSPKDHRLAFWGTVLSNALLRSGRAQEALDEAQAACRRDGKLHFARITAALALLTLGRPEDARGRLAEARRIRPDLTLEEVRMFFGRRAEALLAPHWSTG